MLMRELLLEEYKTVIEDVLQTTNLPHNDTSRDKISECLIRSMGITNSKEPEHCPVYLLSRILSEYQKSNTWPSKFPEFINEIAGITKIPYSTIRSSMENFPWNIPDYLRPKSKKNKAERVVVSKPSIEDIKPIINPELNEETVPKLKPEINEEILPEKKINTIKLKEDYHVVIDFGVFKITIEKVEKVDKNVS